MLIISSFNPPFTLELVTNDSNDINLSSTTSHDDVHANINQDFSDTFFDLDSSSLYFTENLDNLYNKKTLFYTEIGLSIFEFQQSRIILTIHNQSTNEKYVINIDLFQSNKVNPMGNKPSQVPTIVYQNFNKISTISEYSEIIYQNIYDNIDLKFYFNANNLKYDFIIHPRGNYKDITFKVDSKFIFNVQNKSVKLSAINDKNNILFSDSNLFSYQMNNIKITSEFKSKNINNCKNCYGFDVAQYNIKQDLIIDPYWLILNENIIPNNNENATKVSGFQFDSNDNIIILGSVTTSLSSTDIFVSKYSSNGIKEKMVYIGGSLEDNIEMDEHGKGIKVDNNDFIYITGYTYSDDFYLKNPYQNKHAGGEDAFLIKLDDNLDIVYSTYYGGSLNDRGRTIDVYNNDIFLSGITSSLDFPLKNSLQSNFNGGFTDGFVSKFSENFDLLFSTYFGGNLDDEIHTSIVDSIGNLIITGHTTSNKFNISELAIQKTIGSVFYPDAFISKISNDGQSIIFSTYFGGTDYDEGNGLFIDSNGNIMLIGSTKSDTIDGIKVNTHFGGGVLFVTRVFIITINAGGYIPINFIDLDGNGEDYGLSLKEDSSNNIIITGNTLSSNFWDGIKIETGEPNTLTRSFVSRIDTQTNQLDMSSMIYKKCDFTNCWFTSQDIQINHNNQIFLLGNNKFIQNNIDYSYLPFLIEISNINDVEVPKISINSYSIDKTYTPKTNLTLNITDNQSGIKSVSFYWDNNTIKMLNASFIINIPFNSGSHSLTISAVDNAGNEKTQEFKITISTPNYSFITIIGAAAVLSVATGYLTIYLFWKYYFAKKRALKRAKLELDDVQDYVKLIQKDKNLMDEIKIE